MHDNKHGNYVVLLGVTDRGYPDMCTLAKRFFSDPSGSDVLSDSSSFQGHGLGTFLLSLLQVMGFLGHNAHVINNPAAPFLLHCDERIQKFTHHLYLQARLEIGSAYVMYVQLGFTSPVVVGHNYHCRSYGDECPASRDLMPQMMTQ
jgi:hypothetical protein